MALSKIYLDSRHNTFLPEKGVAYLEQALQVIKHKEDELGQNNTEERAMIYNALGKAYTDKGSRLYDLRKALIYFDNCINAGNDENRYKYEAHAQKARIFGSKANKEFYNPVQAEEHYNIALQGNEQLLAEQQEYGDTTVFLEDKICGIRVGLSRLYSDKDSILCNYSKALAVISTIKEDIHGNVALQKGCIYSSEKAAQYDMKKALECFRAAIEKNNTNAMVKLAKCYLFGLGVEKNKEEAVFWLKEAAERGNEYANEYLQKVNSMNFGNYSYMLLRQIFSSMGQARQKCVQKLQETEFKTKSKQVQKEEYLHRN